MIGSVSMMGSMVRLECYPSTKGKENMKQTIELKYKRQPILKNGIRVLYPTEYQKLISVIPKHHHKLIIQTLLHTGCRFTELEAIKENPSLFKDGRYIHLTKNEIKKVKTKIKDRHILLGVFGKDIVKDFVKTPFRIPPRQALNKSLKRWCIKASINPEGICLKSFRKTLISWLVATQEDKYIRVLASIGHDSITSLRHYITIPFDSSDKGLIKSIIYGWGE